MTKEFIIAIELGSSKMTGIAGQKNLDGSITILAVAKEDSTSWEGVFAVGDVRKTPLRQVITAASDGAVGAVYATKYLEIAQAQVV